MSVSKSEETVAACTKSTSALLHAAKETVLYRPSIAYLLQQLTNFIQAIQKFKNEDLPPFKLRALERYITLSNNFLNLMKQISSQWMKCILNVSSLQMHEHIEWFRKSLNEICTQLDMKPEEVIQFDPQQDAVNKVADFQYYKATLRETRDNSLDVANVVDLQQLIEERLRSINSHLPSKSKRRKMTTVDSNPRPTSPEDLNQRMETALDQFKDIDISMDDIKLDNALGSGGFGTVYRGTRLSTGELLAVKEVRSDKLTMSSWASLYSEVATMAKLKHRYVLELVGAHIKPPYRIITRYCPGKSLFDRLHRPMSRQLTPLQLTSLAYQVASGMAFLHANGIVHRDLKTMNILLDEYDAACIADFGLCGLMKENKDLFGGVGTPHYTAPEVLDHRRYGPKVDSYSFGVILWEMATGSIPFRDKSQAEIFEHVVTHGWRLKMPNTVPEGLRKMILRCWSANPNDRPDFDEIAEAFATGRVCFKDCPKINDKSELEAPFDYPPLNIEYIISVLKNPQNEKFPSIVNFLVNNLSQEVRKELIDAKIVQSYTSESPNKESVLLISAALLTDEQFPDFIKDVACPLLENMNKEKMEYYIKFFIAVPIDLYPKLEKFLPQIFDSMKECDSTSALCLELFAKMGKEYILEFKDKIIQFLAPEVIEKVDRQETATALSIIVPYIIDDIPHKSRFIPLLSSNFHMSIEFQKLIVQKISKKKAAKLLVAFIKSEKTNECSDIIDHLLRDCSKEDLKQVATEPNIFDSIDILLKHSHSISIALLILFVFSSIPEVPQMIANHPVLFTMLTLKTHIAQRLQIFTSLFMSQQFLENTTISDGVIKMLVSAMADEKLSPYALRLIAALSSHSAGCKMITDTGMLSLFTQLFLSPACSDLVTSMTILSNIAKRNEQIPQLSLIVSCLMQDLAGTISNRVKILQTLIDLLSSFPDSVQEHYMLSNVLPLIAPDQEPVIVLKAIELFTVVDSSTIRNFYKRLISQVLRILQTPELQFPEIIISITNLLTIISASHDIKKYLVESDFLNYIQSVSSHINPNEQSFENLQNDIFILSRSVA